MIKKYRTLEEADRDLMAFNIELHRRLGRPFIPPRTPIPRFKSGIKRFKTIEEANQDSWRELLARLKNPVRSF